MNSKIITLGNNYIIDERFGLKTGRQFYTADMAAGEIGISFGQLQNLLMIYRIKPSYIRFEGDFLSAEDIDYIQSLLTTSKYEGENNE